MYKLTHEFKGQLYFKLQFYYKGYNWGTDKWKRYTGQGMEGWGWGAHNLLAFSRHAILPEHWCAHQPRSSPNPIVQRSLWRVHYTGMSNYWLSLQPFFPPQRIRYGDLKFRASNHGLVFLLISLQPEAIKEPIKSNPIRTKDTPIT